MSKHVRSDALAIRAEIEVLSRNPFRDILSELVECLPDLERIKEWAKEDPGKLIHSISKITPLAGYKEQVTHEHNTLVQIGMMSDSQLDAKLRELNKLLEAKTEKVVTECTQKNHWDGDIEVLVETKEVINEVQD